MNTTTLPHRVPHYSLCVVNTHVIPPGLTVIIIGAGMLNADLLYCLLSLLSASLSSLSGGSLYEVIIH